MIHNRPYQDEALKGVRHALTDNNSTLLVMATGLGKTITFSQFAGEMLNYGKVLVLAHRGELIDQAYTHLREITSASVGVEMAHENVSGIMGRQPDIVVGTIQTQIAGMDGKGRMSKFDPNDFSLVIIDEAHHSAAHSYRKVIDYYKKNPTIKILGVTATPDRLDEKALGAIFESVAFEYGIKDGITDGWLVPIQQQMIHVEGLDYSKVRTTAGDLNGADLARILEWEENLHEMASPIIDLSGDKKTLLFAATVDQAERMAEILNRHKPGLADWVCGKTNKDKRATIFERFHKGDIQYLCNVGVATEGFDEPGIELVVMARPTKSRSLYAQMIGRGTRTLPGTVDGQSLDAEARRKAIEGSAKPNVSVLDFVGNAGRHRLVTSVDILGGDFSEEAVSKATKKLKKTGDGDVLSVLGQAEFEAAKEQQRLMESAKRKKLVLHSKYSTAKVNPFSIMDVCPCREKGWHKGRQPTEKQLGCLKKFGVDPAGLSFTHASQLIDNLIKRSKEKKCTFKQAALLKRFQIDPHDMTFEKASRTIDAIAKNKWRRPKGMSRYGVEESKQQK